MKRQKFAGTRDRANGAHFRFLGLVAGESDPSAIRSAAGAMAGLIGDCEGQYGVEGLIRRRSEIAVATYRLLDPRQRDSFFERVQLCYPVDHQERTSEIQDLDLKANRASNPWSTPIESNAKAPASDRTVLMHQPVIERAIQEEASDPVAAQAMAETMSWLEERREVVRSLRDNSGSTSLASVPISWIRSVLGW